MDFTKRLIADFENDADRRMSSMCRIMIVLMAIVILLNKMHVFNVSSTIYPTLLVAMAVLFIPTVLYVFFIYAAKRHITLS